MVKILVRMLELKVTSREWQALKELEEFVEREGPARLTPDSLGRIQRLLGQLNKLVSLGVEDE